MLDSDDVSGALQGVLVVQVTAGRLCQPEVSLALPPGTGFVVIGSLIGFPQRRTCPRAVPISVFNIGFKAPSASAMQAVRSAMIEAQARACFDDVLPTDARRHAPPAHMTAWSDAHRLLTFVWDEYDPTIFTVTYLRRDLTLPNDAEQKAYAATRQTLLRPIPPTCLGQQRP